MIELGSIVRISNSFILLFVLCACEMLLTGCGIIGPESVVEVLSQSNQVTETVLTAKHYKSQDHRLPIERKAEA